MGDETTRASIEAVWRLESTRLLAALVRIVRDVALAEDVAHDAIVAALAQWPASGIPDNPAAWLMTTAKRRAIDTFRARARADQAAAALAHELSEAVELGRRLMQIHLDNWPGWEGSCEIRQIAEY